MSSQPAGSSSSASHPAAPLHTPLQEYHQRQIQHLNSLLKTTSSASSSSQSQLLPHTHPSFPHRQTIVRASSSRTKISTKSVGRISPSPRERPSTSESHSQSQSQSQSQSTNAPNSLHVSTDPSSSSDSASNHEAIDLDSIQFDECPSPLPDLPPATDSPRERSPQRATKMEGSAVDEEGDADLTARPANKPPELIAKSQEPSPEGSGSSAPALVHHRGHPGSSQSGGATDTIASPHDSGQSREDEHKKAWQSDGARVYHAIPEGFTLHFDPKRSRRSSEETKSHPSDPGRIPSPAEQRDSGSAKLDVSNGRTRTETDTRSTSANKNSTTDSNAPILSRSFVFHPGTSRLVAQPRDATTTATSTNTSAGPSPVNAGQSSMVKALMPKRKSKPDLRHEASGGGLGNSDAHVRQSSKSSTQPTAPALRDALADEDDDAYEEKREIRMRRRHLDLRRRIGAWANNVEDTDYGVPSIDPTPPSPSVASSKLTISPLVASDTVPLKPTLKKGSGNMFSFSSNLDRAGRMRDLDALLGDMSLKSTVDNSLSTTPTVPSLSTIPNDSTPKKRTKSHGAGGGSGDMAELENWNRSQSRVTARDGMPTPKPKQETSRLGYLEVS